MDAFWFIPFVIVVVSLLVSFWAYIRTQPMTPSPPRVLLDKPSDPPAIDPATVTRDWSGRPCGAYLEWLSNRGE